MEKFKDKYRIPSARFYPHSYNEGTFFITICTHERKHYFGNIVDKEMHLSKLGRYVDSCISQIPIVNENVILHSFVVMPNHIHLVLSVFRNVETLQYGVLKQCGNQGNEPQSLKTLPQSLETPHWDVSTQMKLTANSCGRLSHIISQMKGVVTKYAKNAHISFAWQTRFHDHVIRDSGEFDGIMNYVITNIENWENDCFCIEHT